MPGRSRLDFRWLIAAAAFALGVALCWGVQLASGPQRSSEQQSFWRVQAAHLARLDAMTDASRVVFIGSSTFQGLDVAAVTPIGLNLSIGGDTIDGLLRRASSYSSLRNPAAIVVNIGFNDVAQSCDAVAAATWRRLLQGLARGQQVIVVGIQGVSPARAAEFCDGGVASLVARSNTELQRVCRSTSECHYVPNPVPPVPTAEHAHLHAPDGVHLSSAGYRVLQDRLRRTLASAPAAD